MEHSKGKGKKHEIQKKGSKPTPPLSKQAPIATKLDGQNIRWATLYRHVYKLCWTPDLKTYIFVV